MRLTHLPTLSPAFKKALLLFLILRLFLTGWAILVGRIVPLPTEPDEFVRPYLGEPILSEGVTGALLGPWQRFDGQRYLRIARQGYTAEEDSVFPPLYPLLINGFSRLGGSTPVARLVVAILLSNGAALALFYWLYQIVKQGWGTAVATRTLIYFALFPAAFFLFAPYTESIFILLALTSLWCGQNGRFGWAGVLGGLAALTRLTGWILIVPLLYEYYRQNRVEIEQERLQFIWRSPQRLVTLTILALPSLVTAVFFGWRWAMGLPPLSTIYETYWYQTVSFPGMDMITAVETLFFGGVARAGQFTFAFDFLCALFLIVTTVLTFHRFGGTYGFYAVMLLLFIFLPTSFEKPLYSFSRYTLAFFPAFILLGIAGENGWVHRLILYPFLALYLYFTGQFFLWGWVA